jgi:DNA primase
MLAQAVLAGLARHPDQVARHAEALLSLTPGEPQLAAAIDTLFERAETLESAASSPISAAATLTPPPDSSRFSFLVEGTDPQTAREDLAEAVALLVERPALEAAIAAATARFASDPEGAFAEQQRLRQRKLEIESRLGHMARKRAGSGAPQDQSAAADSLRAGEQETG